MIIFFINPLTYNALHEIYGLYSAKYTLSIHNMTIINKYKW